MGVAGDARLIEIHRELEHARTPRDLRALLRAAALQFPGHLNDCTRCSEARDRIEDRATDLHGRVEHDFSWHPPLTKRAEEQIERLCTAAKTLAHEIVDSTPVSREQSRALSSLEDALAQAIAGLTRNQA